MGNGALLEKLAALSLQIDIEWNTDKPVRNGSQWFIGKEFTTEKGMYQIAWFGDYKTGKQDKWQSETGGLSSDDEKKIKIQTEAALAAQREAREKVFLERAVECTSEFESFSDRGDTPYMRRKQIPQLFGCRVAPNDQGDPILVVPLRDVDGTLWNYQRVYSQKLSKGDKFFEAGARIEGLFHALSVLPEENAYAGQIFLAEGFATAASVQQAFPAIPVLAAFNAGNLLPVGQAIRARYPKAKITVCADNDVYTYIGGQPVNVGLNKGRAAAGTVSGEIRYPVFKRPQKGLTDFNDLQAAEGLDMVRDQIKNFDKYVHGIQPMCLPVTKSGKTQPPSEKQVADFC